VLRSSGVSLSKETVAAAAAITVVGTQSFFPFPSLTTTAPLLLLVACTLLPRNSLPNDKELEILKDAVANEMPAIYERTTETKRMQILCTS